MQEIVGEILLDDITLVATANDEVIYAVSGINLHDVPKDRAAAYLNHGLRFQMCFLGYARTEPAGEDN